ncbi:cardiolipin synthase (CMP-forming) isoform X2 [Alligator mississippiensis]|uniref:cardiolipin synthase (CMP-forming) isoform X2 n=1 Tax=Alligator mississippiensis TaxID=8496 RepID=UPI0028772DBF|nr:cardiolipin synthase (CMP-forming) isoform X2 [Alligator mississippiensis]
MLAAAWLGRGFWGPLRGVRPLAGSGGSCPGPRRPASLSLGLGLGLGLTLAPAPRAAGCLRLLRAPAACSHRAAAPLPPPPPTPPPRPEPEPPQEAAWGELYENPWTIPNLLSLVRIGLAPVLGYLIVEEDFNVALGVFTLAGITDLLDGFIARNWANQKSALGSALDPLADKILISVLYVSLTCANLIPVPLTSLIILRDIVLVAAVFYVRFKTLSPPRTLSRYFNPCYATAQLKPTFISKMNTAVQLILVAASLAAPVFNYVDSVYLHILWSKAQDARWS